MGCLVDCLVGEVLGWRHKSCSTASPSFPSQQSRKCRTQIAPGWMGSVPSLGLSQRSLRLTAHSTFCKAGSQASLISAQALSFLSGPLVLHLVLLQPRDDHQLSILGLERAGLERAVRSAAGLCGFWRKQAATPHGAGSAPDRGWHCEHWVTG